MNIHSASMQTRNDTMNTAEPSVRTSPQTPHNVQNNIG